jgi:hypothetical protein
VAAILHILEQHFAIALDGIERRSQVMTQPSAVGLDGLLLVRDHIGRIEEAANEHCEIDARGAHAVEIGDCLVEMETTRLLDQDVEKSGHRDDGCVQFLAQECCQGLLKPVERFRDLG